MYNDIIDQLQFLIPRQKRKVICIVNFVLKVFQVYVSKLSGHADSLEVVRDEVWEDFRVWGFHGDVE